MCCARAEIMCVISDVGTIKRLTFKTPVKTISEQPNPSKILQKKREVVLYGGLIGRKMCNCVVGSTLLKIKLATPEVTMVFYLTNKTKYIILQPNW